MAGYKTWSPLEEITAANMNSYLRDNSIPQFANAAARTAAIVSPVVGTASYLLDTGSYEVYYGATTGWRRPWANPWGVLNAAQNTAAASSTGTEVDIPGMSMTFTAVTGRLYAIHLQVVCGNPGSPIDWIVRVKEGSTLVAYAAQSFHNTASESTQTLSFYGTFTAGSHTIKATIQRTGGSGTATVLFPNNTANPNFFIQDIGPLSAPPAS